MDNWQNILWVAWMIVAIWFGVAWLFQRDKINHQKSTIEDRTSIIVAKNEEIERLVSTNEELITAKFDVQLTSADYQYSFEKAADCITTAADELELLVNKKNSLGGQVSSVSRTKVEEVIHLLRNYNEPVD